jgi:putative DNA primase/helicase
MADTENKDGGVSPPWVDLEAYREAYRARNPLPEPEQVVAELAQRRQWLLWRYEPGETPEKKPRKMPYYANKARRYGDQGSERDRAALTSFAGVADAYRRGGFDGVGFAFLPADGLVGIDLDGMVDVESGEVTQRCQDIIAACASYTEWSPSGTGVHIICRRDDDTFDGIGRETFKSNKIGVEVFSGRQYFTFTGRPWAGAPDELALLSNKVARRLFATVKPPAAQATPAAPPPAGFGERSAAETVALAEEAVKFLSPDDYQTWIDVGLACKSSLGPAGFVVWDAWSRRSAKYVAGDMQRRWESFKPSEITVATIFGRAKDAGWSMPKSSKKSTAKESDGDGEKKKKKKGRAPDDPEAWRDHLYERRGEVTDCLANVVDVVTHRREWDGVLAYNEFALQVVKLKPPPYQGGASGDWEDVDDARTAIWITRQEYIATSSGRVREAIVTASKYNAFHPVRDWLAGLPAHDGVERLDTWLIDYLGVEDKEYARLVSRWYLIGMIARVMQPGVQFDTCLVLEGGQGAGKSSALRILAGEWFHDTDLNLNDKDAMVTLQGVWLHEFAELDSLAKVEASKQKSFISRREDKVRPAFGRGFVKMLRQCVFAGTQNLPEWIKDSSGARRFWPVDCGLEINMAGLADVREQLFAEALVAWKAGERFHPTRVEQDKIFRPEQERRQQQNSFVDALHDWVYGRTEDFSLAMAVMDGLRLDASKLTPSLTTSVGIALSKLGCRRVEKRNGMTRYWYRPPVLDDEAPVMPQKGREEAGHDAPF